MSPNCAECGANLSEGVSCQSIYESFLVLEYTDYGYGEVHMLTVACFMIQHRRYSDEALIWIEQKLHDYFERGIPVDQIRRRAEIETDQTRRAWKVIRQADAPPLPEIAWSMTIVDVAANYQDAQSYCELVERWARITLHEMKPLLTKS